MSITPNNVVEYPESDGKPMGETDWHIYWVLRLRDLLQTHYRDKRVYVGSDMFVYFEEGNPKQSVVPDGFVVFDCDPKFRRTFKTWEEGRTPSVVFEISSRSTAHVDQVIKPEIYTRLGVLEYFLFDPEADYLEPPLQGYRLTQGDLVPMEPVAGSLVSLQCQCRLWVEQGALRLADLTTDQPWLTTAEMLQALCESEQKAKHAEHTARLAAEQEIFRLRAEIERLRGQL